MQLAGGGGEGRGGREEAGVGEEERKTPTWLEATENERVGKQVVREKEAQTTLSHLLWLPPCNAVFFF